MDKRIKILLMAVGIGLLIAIVSTSYAFFTIANKEGEESVITSGTMGLHLEDGPEVGLENAIPGASVTKTFYVENTGNVDTAYDIYLSEVVNTFVDKTDLVYTLTSNDGGYSTTEQVEVPSTSSKIVDSQAIPVSGIHHYTLTITFLNKNENQDDNQGKEFNGKIQINEYTNANGGGVDPIDPEPLNNPTMRSCPNCRYTWDYDGGFGDTVDASDLELFYDNYEDLIAVTNKKIFLAFDFDGNKVSRIFACGIEHSTPFCIEASKGNTDLYEYNRDNVLGPIYGWTQTVPGYGCYEDLSLGTDCTGEIDVRNEIAGYIRVDYASAYCDIDPYDSAYCAPYE